MKYTMTFYFADGACTYQHINRVDYPDSSVGKMTVSDAAIFSHDFPLNRDFHVYSDDKSIKISFNGLRRIEITKED